ncbi:phosphoribosyltransferase [Tessaracoccus lapidicaptus]|uniref:phosphoribosyltransferase n=1 Tax=Tessaracoccus lapidicaptus TaxID=1427523 RepID=UPI00333F55AE
MSSKPIVTVGENELTHVVGQLVDKILRDGFEPQAVVGIATGGAIAARQIDPALGWVLFVCTLRRPSTGLKTGLPGVSAALRRVPSPVADLLRRAEDRLGELMGPRPSVVNLEAPLRETAEVVRSKGLTRILVMDDAVDSGATLARVVHDLRSMLPDDVEVRTAAICQTRESGRSMIAPDYVVFERTLCRFHWSLDYRARPQ